MRKIIFILLALAVLAGTYFVLDYRKNKFIEENRSDEHLGIDNPSEKDILLLLNDDSVIIPGRTVVYLPVNTAKLLEKPAHIRSFDAATHRLILDSTVNLPDTLMDFFLNPSLSRYLRFSHSYMAMRVYAANPETFQPMGNAFLMSNDMGNSDTSFIASLVIDCKDCISPLSPAATAPGPAEAPEHTHIGSDHIIVRESGEKKLKEIFYYEDWTGFFSPKKVLTTD